MSELPQNLKLALELYKQYHPPEKTPTSEKSSKDDEESYTAADEVAETIQNVAQQIIQKLKEEKVVSETQSEQLIGAMNNFVKSFHREQRLSAIINLIATFALPYAVQFFSKYLGGENRERSPNV